jgi:hypothetical protein
MSGDTCVYNDDPFLTHLGFSQRTPADIYNAPPIYQSVRKEEYPRTSHGGVPRGAQDRTLQGTQIKWPRAYNGKYGPFVAPVCVSEESIVREPTYTGAKTNLYERSLGYDSKTFPQHPNLRGEHLIVPHVSGHHSGTTTRSFRPLPVRWKQETANVCVEQHPSLGCRPKVHHSVDNGNVSSAS